jgi:phosphate:Na+ symporter
VERVLETLCSSTAAGLENAVEGGTVRATIDDATIRQASDAMQQASAFLSDIGDLPPYHEGHQWFISTLHALDHAGRLAGVIVEMAKKGLSTEGPEEVRAAKLCTKLMRDAAAVAARLAVSAGPGHAADNEVLRTKPSNAIATDASRSLANSADAAVERMELCSKELADLRAAHRRATLDSVASGTLTASAAIARVDAVGLLDRVAHHAWRAALHLESAVASGMEPEQ